MMITVLLADDDQLTRTGLRLILESDPDLTVLGEAADGQEAIHLARALHPDVVLMDIRMPEVDGLEATRRIAQGAQEGPHVLILTTFELDEYVFGALRAGASGFLLKRSSPEVLIEAIKVVAAGDVDPTRAGGALPGWSRPVKRGAGGPSVHQRGDRQDARQTHPDEAGTPR